MEMTAETRGPGPARSETKNAAKSDGERHDWTVA
jgi:hypothetical protein